MTFKANENYLRTPRRFMLIHAVIKIYSIRFFVRIEQISIQGNHIHLLIHATRRTNFQAFFRVVAGQIPQRLEKLELFKPRIKQTTRRRTRHVTDTLTEKCKFWEHRPFTRIVAGARDYANVRDYIQLNELEAIGAVAYRPTRLKGLSHGERWRLLWAPSG